VLLCRLDPFVTPEAFAQTVVDDYQLAPSYLSQIAKQIQEQLVDYQTHLLVPDDDEDEQPQQKQPSLPISTERDVDSVVKEVSTIGGVAKPIRGKLDEHEAKWWDGWRERVWAPRKRRKLDTLGRDLNKEIDKEMLPVNARDLEAPDDDAPEEMRIVIKVRPQILGQGVRC
jgi:SWI/SNF-related matrix-associated actin-dependent regulator of chromatin subfamily B member 1